MAKQQSSSRLVGMILETFGGPLIGGLLATFGYYFAVSRGILHHDLLVRYTAGHPVEYVEVALFFIGLTAVIRLGRRTVGQLLGTGNSGLKPVQETDFGEQVAALDQQTRALPRKIQQSIYGRRLLAAIGHLRRHNSSDHLDDELKYLSDMDAEASHEGYALVRIIIWATPMLGFLGTVIGITMALGGLSPEALVNSPKEAMEGLLSGLSVAFDTTALALTLSIVLMFAQFLTQQVDTQLLMLVDRKVTEDFSPYFRQNDASSDPQVATLQNMAKVMIASMETNTQRQTEIWQQALAAGQQQWISTVHEAGDAVRGAVAEGVRESMNDHTANLIRLEEAAGQAASSHWQQWHLASAEILKELRSQETHLTQHGEILSQALQATGEIMNLENALNQNLRALAGAKNFEDTVMSLSAAIHLLSSRLSKPMPRDSKVRLEAKKGERAA